MIKDERAGHTPERPVIEGIRLERWINAAWEDPRFRLVGVLLPVRLMEDPLSPSVLLEIERRVNSYASSQAEIKRLREALEEYGRHDEDKCVLRRWQGGEPTADGGYRTMYAGKWYQSRPVDETPKCNCGFDAALTPTHSPEAGG